jgi:hypothetical protein
LKRLRGEIGDRHSDRVRRRCQPGEIGPKKWMPQWDGLTACFKLHEYSTTLNDELAQAIFALHCNALCCTAMYSDAQQWFAMHCNALQCTTMHYYALRCTAMHCDALRCTAMHCDAQCTAMHCDALRCTAMHCDALRCTAMHCDALRCTAMHCDALRRDSVKIDKLPFYVLLRYILHIPKNDDIATTNLTRYTKRTCQHCLKLFSSGYTGMYVWILYKD